MKSARIPDAPAGVPDSFSEHMQLMFDLQVLALQTDMTRVISFKTGRDSQNRVFPESGSSQPFHPASHHGNRKTAILEFNKICKYRVSQLAYFLEKMKTTMDGEQSLLDKTMIVWGSPMADANVHNHRRCPLVLLGHANGALKGNAAPEGRRRHADGQRDADHAAPAGSGRHEQLRRQHGRVLAVGAGRHDGRSIGRRVQSSKFKVQEFKSSKLIAARRGAGQGGRRLEP